MNPEAKIPLSNKLLVLAAFGLAAVLSAGAQTPEPGPKVGLAGVRIYGGDLSLTSGPWSLTAGGGWESVTWGRNWATGAPVGLGADGKAANASWTDRNGSVSGRYTLALDEGDLWAGAGAVGYEDLGTGAAASGAFADRTGGLFAYLQAGATRDRRSKNGHGVQTGTFLEASAEVGPPVLAVRGTDYGRFGLRSSALVLLWDLEGPSHIFSGVLGVRANAQWTDGRAVPVVRLEPTEVRGYQRVLDTKFRSVGTAELRIKGPSLWGPRDFVPVVFFFGEGGWYAGYANAPPADRDRTGFLASAGGGLGLDILGATTPTLTLCLPLADGESDLAVKINFNLRF